MRVDIERADGTKIAIEGDDEAILRIARELAQSPYPAAFEPRPYLVPFPVVIPAQPGPYDPAHPWGPVIFGVEARA